MRRIPTCRFLVLVLSALLFPGFVACAARLDNASVPGSYDRIIVRRFTAPRRIVVLDPSLGFSLHRGQKGVPPADRAASVARATAFILADAITQRLREMGFDAVQSDEVAPQASGRVLIVAGVFRRINEGHRRYFAAKDASLVMRAEIAAQSEGGKPTPLKVLRLVSTETRKPSRTDGEPGVKAVALRLAHEIAESVAALVHPACAGCSRR